VVLKQEIISKVRAASRIKVIRSLKHSAGKPLPANILADGMEPAEQKIPAATASKKAIRPYLPEGVIVIGASTGGPVAIRELLSGLSADCKASIIVVQHLPASFSSVLVAQLNRSAPFETRLAAAGDQLEPGILLVAPGDHHLLVGPSGCVELNNGPVINGHRPSIDVTMQSVAQVYGSSTTGILLTGMGNDGAQGMVTIRARQGRTFAQDAESCVVNGMPQRAIDKGVVDWIGPPLEIGRFLRSEKNNSPLTQTRMKHVIPS
jgi:two-component system chemotaxis response regulator CheB